MTRNSDLDLDDLTECDHTPEIAVMDGTTILWWLCRCGRRIRPEKEEHDDQGKTEE